MRILFVSQWFDPEPTIKGMALMRELSARGHKVEVLTSFPNYPEGKVYPGYKLKLYQKEVIDEITIHRVALYPSHTSSALKRMMTYLSLAIAMSTIGLITVKKADVCYIYDPTASVILPALLLRFVRRMRYVIDIQDLWPDSLSATGMFTNPIGLKLVNIMCNAIYKYSEKIIASSPGFKTALESRGVPSDKIKVIYNWCDESKVKPGEYSIEIAEKFNLNGKFNIIFAGTMGKAQSLDCLLDVADHLKKDYPDIQIVFVGGGTESQRLKQESKNRGLSNVLFIPRQPLNEIDKILNVADALLIHLKDTALFKITIPSKTQAYMAMGKPILMCSSGNALELIKDAEAGIECLPECTKSILSGIIKMYELKSTIRTKMGLNALEYYNKNLAFNVGVNKLEELLNSLVAN